MNIIHTGRIGVNLNTNGTPSNLLILTTIFLVYLKPEQFMKIMQTRARAFAGFTL